jgi:hypothetical protein
VCEFSVKKYALMCMRLAAECRGLAADVPEPDLRAQFLRLASMWTELAKMPRVLH